jgi:hypothetical protein
MRHLRWIPPGEWPQEEDPETGELRDASVRGGMVQGMVLLGEHPDGGWLVDCVGREGRDYPGWRIASGAIGGRNGDGRYAQLPDRLQAVAYRAVVYREPEGAAEGLRARVEREVGEARPARVSPRGAGDRPAMEHRARDAADALERARELAAREPPEARRMRVPLAVVREQDLVEREARPGARWAGEEGG